MSLVGNAEIIGLREEFEIEMRIYPFNNHKKKSHLTLKIIGGAALAALVAGVIVALPDLKRYIKISTM